MIKLHDRHFKPFISAEEIDTAVQKMADAIASDLGDEIPVFVGILNGSFMLVSDFVKKYPKPCEVTFIKLASYEGLKSTEDIQRLIGLTQDLTGRTVIILEDIIDTGNTLHEVHRIFKNENVIITFAGHILLQVWHSCHWHVLQCQCEGRCCCVHANRGC